MMRIQKVLFVLAFVLSTVSAYSQFSGGDGTEGNPFQVTTAEGLNGVRNYPDANFIMLDDIDLTDYLTDGNPGYNAGAFWEPIGNDSVKFTGNFNGNNFRVLALSINRPAEDNVGLFGFVSYGTITDLGVETDQSPFVVGNNNVGGLAGHLEYSQVSGCYFKGDINAVANSVGGLVGWCDFSSSIANSYSSGEVHGAQTIGGLAGFVSHDSGVNDSYSSSLVFGTESTAGLVGCIAYSGTYINRSYATGDITGAGLYTGGFVGYDYMGAVITDCYSTGDVLAGGTYVGGFIGMNHSSSLINCYSTGEVFDGGSSGGFCGFINSGDMTGCYWDMGTSGLSTTSGGEGKTTAEMKQQSTYSGMDFSTPVWVIDPLKNFGYPYFNYSQFDAFAFEGGDGTSGNPYQISTPEQLNHVRYLPDADFILLNDIDLTDYLSDPNPGYNDGDFWQPIGKQNGEFLGVFNGNHKKISGLKINRPTTDDIGLFGRTDSSEIFDLFVEIDPAASIIGFYSVGTLAGNCHNDIITNCGSTGQIDGNEAVGGLIGISFSTIKQCFSSTAVTSNLYAGGLVGYSDGLIENSYASGTVTGNLYVGGLAGSQNNNSITNCYAVGSVSAGSSIGGLVGVSWGGISVSSSYWDYETTGQMSSTGSDPSFAKTTAEMKLGSTFAGWDFDFTWIINPAVNGGYPFHPNSQIDPFAFAGGDGTEGDPYQISTSEQLYYVRYFSDKSFILNNDLDLTVFLTDPNTGYSEGAFWKPIGNGIYSFTGKFNGNNLKITGLKINRPAQDYVGLFGSADNCEITGLTVEIDPVSNITGKDYVGGLIGAFGNGSVINCNSTGSVIGSISVGGLIGYDQIGSVDKSYSGASVTGSSHYIGGLTGYNNGTITNCYTTGTVSGWYSGGLVGFNQNGVVDFSYSTGAVIGSSPEIGGLVGVNSSTITNSFWDKETSGQTTSSGGEGKTTAEMKQVATYTGWNLNTAWAFNRSVNSGYPFLLDISSISFAGGDGTEGNPYQISTPEQLNNVRYYPESYFIQINNIDLNVSPYNVGEGWVPIGYEEITFKGTYDGQGFAVNNMYIMNTYSYNALFGKLSNALLKNIEINNCNVTGSEYSAALAGYVSGSTIQGCSVKTGTVATNSGISFIGGLTGYCTASLIEGSDSGVSLTSADNDYVGGIAGGIYSSTIIRNCQNTGSISGWSCVGGIAGYADFSTIDLSSSTGAVTTGNSNAGGLLGTNNYSIITNSNSSGTVNSSVNNVGGFIGFNIGTVTNCWSSGETHGFVNVGGFAGYSNQSTITDCYSLSDTYGESQVGGFIGVNSNADAIRCHSTGSVNATGVMSGGFIGQQYYGNITDCYSEGAVNSSSSESGGFIGWAEYFTISKSYSTGIVSNDGAASLSIGGFVGSANSISDIISDCYSSGNVLTTNGNVVGGFAGYLNCQISACYSTGQVTGTGMLGGFIGDSAGGTSTGPDCYWDTETSGLTDSEGGIGKTTLEMKQFSTYAGWNFDTLWGISPAANSGYPFFRNSSIDPFTFAGGDGTEGDPYQISTAEQLNYVRYYLDSFFILINDIDLTDYLSDLGYGYNNGAFWNPIGSEANPFKGNFNGNYKKITNLKINRPSNDHVGFFGFGDLCSIYSLTLETDKGSLVKGQNIVGGLIGLMSSSVAANCIFEGSVSGINYVGGFAGSSNSSHFNQISTKGSITGSNYYIGGLIGYANSTSINNDYSFSTVNGLNYCGGLLGVAESSNITNCYSAGRIYGTPSDTGGLIGNNGLSSVTNSYWDTETSLQTTSFGGEGKTTAEMQSVATYTDWDFTTTPIWAINEYLNDGYPYFNWDKNFHFAGGNGRPDNPFLVATPDHLNNVRNGMYANFRQTADIDLGVSPWKDGKGWNPIGYYNSDTDYGPFRGIYDGNVFIITNLTINRPLSHSTGLFGYIYQSTITNFNLQGVNVVGGIENTGALAGMVNNGNVFNSVSNGSVQGGNFTGGLIGYNTSGSTIENCSTYGSVSSSGEYTGGLVGLNYNVSIINRCFSNGDVLGTTVAGGLAGMNSGDSEINESYSTGAVYGVDGIGGFIGNEGDGSKAERCFALGDVTSTGTNAGGFIGLVFSTSEVNDSYSRGNVNGDINVGGFIGYNHTSTLTNCYATGTVSAVTGPAGGFAAFNFASTITASYWDTETSGQSASAGGIGKTTDDMTYLFGSDVYTGWNFDTVWVGSYNNNDAYPHLAWQGLTGIEEESSLPKVTALHQNYPNPFNPATSIRFDLNIESDVSLTVYNSNGQMVKELVSGKMSAGYHNVTFDAADLNSGLYFYRLNYGNRSMTKKMMLVK